eukprot:TRINITY_DN2281_c0_g1_i1.p1 TRINITY_DN2281_c0_g1~~TRINITY_DN2281_c0_g1_i1.p1  ORF type:complete len:1060 (+),score=243.11 TRINITY_DN2281_c0_g1_i1:55-3234(+)
MSKVVSKVSKFNAKSVYEKKEPLKNDAWVVYNVVTFGRIELIHDLMNSIESWYGSSEAEGSPYRTVPACTSKNGVCSVTFKNIGINFYSGSFEMTLEKIREFHGHILVTTSSPLTEEIKLTNSIVDTIYGPNSHSNPFLVLRHLSGQPDEASLLKGIDMETQFKYSLRNIEDGTLLQKVPMILQEMASALNIFHQRELGTLSDRFESSANVVEELKRELPEDLSGLLENPLFSDVKFVFPSTGNSIQAHKFVIMTRVPTTIPLFEGTWKGPEVEIQNVSYKIFHSVIQSIYKGASYIEFNDDNLKEYEAVGAYFDNIKQSVASYISDIPMAQEIEQKATKTVEAVDNASVYYLIDPFTDEWVKGTIAPTEEAVIAVLDFVQFATTNFQKLNIQHQRQVGAHIARKIIEFGTIIFNVRKKLFPERDCELVTNSTKALKSKIIEAVVYFTQVKFYLSNAIKALFLKSGLKRRGVIVIFAWILGLFNFLEEGSSELDKRDTSSDKILYNIMNSRYLNNLKTLHKKCKKYPARWENLLIWILSDAFNHNFWAEIYGVWEAVCDPLINVLKCFTKEKAQNQLDKFKEWTVVFKPKDYVPLDLNKGQNLTTTVKEIVEQKNYEAPVDEYAVRALSLKQVNVCFSAERLNHFQEKVLLPDVQFKCSDGTVDSHKALLSWKSPQFKSFFENSGSSTVELPSFKSSNVQYVLDLVYFPNDPPKWKKEKDWKELYNIYLLFKFFKLDTKPFIHYFVDNFEDISLLSGKTTESGYHKSQCGLLRDLWGIVIGHLNAVDLFPVSTTCKLFYYLSKNPEIVSRVSLLPYPALLPFEVNMKGKWEFARTLLFRETGTPRHTFSPVILPQKDTLMEDQAFQMLIEVNLKMVYRNIKKSETPLPASCPLHNYSKSLRVVQNWNFKSKVPEWNPTTLRSVVYVNDTPILVNFIRENLRSYLHNKTVSNKSVKVSIFSREVELELNEFMVDKESTFVWFVFGLTSQQEAEPSYQVREKIRTIQNMNPDFKIIYVEIEAQRAGVLIPTVVAHVLSWLPQDGIVFPVGSQHRYATLITQ